MIKILPDNQRGDTLVEVALALAIMSTVLIASFSLAQKSLQLGNVARDRSMMVSAAEQQAELLMAYRDRNNWATFKYNVIHASGSCIESGIGCFTLTPALALNNGVGEVAGVTTGKLTIRSTGCETTSLCTFQIDYMASPEGSGVSMKSHIVLKLGDTDSLRTKVTAP